MRSSRQYLSNLRDRARKRRQEWARTAGIRRRLSYRARSIVRPVFSLSRRAATRRHPAYRGYLAAGRQFQNDLQAFLANDGRYTLDEVQALDADLEDLARAAAALRVEAGNRRRIRLRE